MGILKLKIPLNASFNTKKARTTINTKNSLTIISVWIKAFSINPYTEATSKNDGKLSTTLPKET